MGLIYSESQARISNLADRSPERNNSYGRYGVLYRACWYKWALCLHRWVYRKRRGDWNEIAAVIARIVMQADTGNRLLSRSRIMGVVRRGLRAASARCDRYHCRE